MPVYGVWVKWRGLILSLGLLLLQVSLVAMTRIRYKSSQESMSSSQSEHTGSYDSRLEHNVSRVLDTLVASHDRRIRPNYGGPPTEVNVTMHVITLSAISEVTMDYTIDLYLRQFWHDTRLSFKAADGMLYSHERGESNANNSTLTVGIDLVKSIWEFGDCSDPRYILPQMRSIRLTVTANCPMNLHKFPLDVQLCPLEIESYGYGTEDIIYHWQTEKAVTMDEHVHLAHFSIGEHFHVERVISLSTGNYSRLTSYFTFKRNIGFYLIQIYFPSSLIVVISWVSFFLNREATQARVAIGVTIYIIAVLTQTTLMTSTNAALPKVKSLDIFLGVCFFIVFASLLEYAMVGFLMRRERYLNFPKSSTYAGNSACYYELDGDQSISGRPAGPQSATPATARKHQMPKKKSISMSAMEKAIPLLTLPMPGKRLLISESPILYASQRLRVRPSRVDLFSRIAFPIFFLLFHLAYWTIYMNLNV